MSSKQILGENVVDLNAARAAREETARRARPLQTTILKAFAAGLSAGDRAKVREAVAGGYESGRSTQDIVRSIRRDEIRQKARAAL